MGTLARDAARAFAAVLLCAFAFAAAATEEGATILYHGGGDGKVTFDGRLHAGKGYACRDCHTLYAPTGTQLFPTARKGFIDKASHKTKTLCFACHDGKTASKECESCHRENAP